MACRLLLRLTSNSGPSVTERMSLGVTTVYDQVKHGLLPRPIKLTQRSSAWPEDEIAAVVAARIAGKSDAEIRSLVKSLMAARIAATELTAA
jgi:prophage regulatory protein